MALFLLTEIKKEGTVEVKSLIALAQQQIRGGNSLDPSVAVKFPLGLQNGPPEEASTQDN